MTDRPTPEQLAASPDDIIAIAKDQLLADLRFHGYVIVHPDDVPEDPPDEWWDPYSYMDSGCAIRRASRFRSSNERNTP